ncbi:MAG: hypothetical protein MZV70_65870 [Desulfobacterales bacterium]|nr:hypothetical protein [Desulfobacterales bacterium]
MKNDLRRGIDAKAVTKANILLGNNVCFVITCVIDGGADLKRLVAGAVEAGGTPDVISRCCTSAGVKPSSVAQAFQSAARACRPCNSRGGAVPRRGCPVRIAAPAGPPAGKVISPSSF